MNVEELREFCLSLPGATEDIKWGDHLCFCLAGKIFCITGLEPPLQVSLKIPEEQFDELTQSRGILQAAHFARRQWINVPDEALFGKAEWERYLRQSYEMVKAGLPKKTRDAIEERGIG